MSIKKYTVFFVTYFIENIFNCIHFLCQKFPKRIKHYFGVLLYFIKIFSLFFLENNFIVLSGYTDTTGITGTLGLLQMQMHVIFSPFIYFYLIFSANIIVLFR